MQEQSGLRAQQRPLPPPRMVPRSPAIGLPPDGNYARDPRRMSVLLRAREQTIPYAEIRTRWFPTTTIDHLRKWHSKGKDKRGSHNEKGSLWQQFALLQDSTATSLSFEQCLALESSMSRNRRCHDETNRHHPAAQPDGSSVDQHTAVYRDEHIADSNQIVAPVPVREQTHDLIHLEGRIQGLSYEAWQSEITFSQSQPPRPKNPRSLMTIKLANLWPLLN